jgi:hypothetical protein
VSDVAFDVSGLEALTRSCGLTLNRLIGLHLATYPHPIVVFGSEYGRGSRRERRQVRAATNTALRLMRSAATPSSTFCVDAAQVDFGLMRANRCPERRA